VFGAPDQEERIMRSSERLVAVTTLLVSGLVAVAATAGLVATAWRAVAAEMDGSQGRTGFGTWFWLVLAVSATAAALGAARRLRDIRSVGGEDEPNLWI
jgi:hypothetical protein